MIYKLIKHILFINIIFLLSCDFAYEKKIINNYYLIALDDYNDICISYKVKGGYIGIITQKITAVGFNKNFIIAKHYKIYYYIIPLKQKISEIPEKNLIGPMNKEEYIKKRNELSIPNNLDFTIFPP